MGVVEVDAPGRAKVIDALTSRGVLINSGWVAGDADQNPGNHWKGAPQEQVAVAGRYALLTFREREVMSLVVAGLANKRIAGRLGITEMTVKIHRGKVMRKMQAASLPELVRMAEGLFPGRDESLD